MIERYTRREMAEIWEPENRFRIWLAIEIYAAEAMSHLGLVPQDALIRIKRRANFDVQKIDEYEQVVKHDVIAFLTSVADYIGEDSAYLHMGLTSSDILDTAFAVQLKQATDILIEDVKEIIAVLQEKAERYRDVPVMGRTHGVHAEPVTFGLKFLSWLEEMKRNLKRLREARREVAVGKLSGAVGTFANVDPYVEEYVMRKLGLKPEPVSTQIVPRDRHARYFTTLAVIGSSIERFAVEIRHLQRTEVREAEEFFSKGQKGSSAMPHKRNPILSENLSGLARLLRGYALSSMENVALWHERDISHSSVERVIGPDATIVLDFMLRRFLGVLKNLVVYPEKAAENIEKSYNLFFSQRLMLELAKKGLPRNRAYEIVQEIAMRSWEKGRDFKKLVLSSRKVQKYLTREEMESIFDIRYYFRNVGYIYGRCLKEKRGEKE
ncbi:MAG: adenylosuccinate lyase [Deltaproteobacteria bacterium]|nr:MAG: adenylosuccinate lyase [Deltaproteobacteria bacterium]